MQPLRLIEVHHLFLFRLCEKKSRYSDREHFSLKKSIHNDERKSKWKKREPWTVAGTAGLRILSMGSSIAIAETFVMGLLS